MTLSLFATRLFTPILLGVVLSVSLSVPSPGHAETLENLMGSKAMQDFRISKSNQQGEKKKGPPPNQWLRGIDPSTNFASVWISSNAPQLLLNWAGAKLPYFTYRRPRSDRSSNLVTAEVELSNFDRINCKLAIMVPHPSIVPLVEANVLEEFRKLRPPMLEVVGEKPVTLANGKGTLYEHKKGEASLLIPISQHGLIRITTLDYKNAQILIDIAKGLDIDRLNRKLDS